MFLVVKETRKSFFIDIIINDSDNQYFLPPLYFYLNQFPIFTGFCPMRSSVSNLNDIKICMILRNPCDKYNLKSNPDILTQVL